IELAPKPETGDLQASMLTPLACLAQRLSGRLEETAVIAVQARRLAALLAVVDMHAPFDTVVPRLFYRRHCLLRGHVRYSDGVRGQRPGWLHLDGAPSRVGARGFRSGRSTRATWSSRARQGLCEPTPSNSAIACCSMCRSASSIAATERPWAR